MPWGRIQIKIAKFCVLKICGISLRGCESRTPCAARKVSEILDSNPAGTDAISPGGSESLGAWAPSPAERRRRKVFSKEIRTVFKLSFPRAHCGRGRPRSQRIEASQLLAQDEVLRQRGDFVALVGTATTVQAPNGKLITGNGPFADLKVPLAGLSPNRGWRSERGDRAGLENSLPERRRSG